MVVYAALAGNAAVAIVKFFAAFWTGSSAMLSEAIHSSVDTADQALMLYGLARAQRPPDPEHPLGHGRELYFWSFTVALLIFTLGAGFTAFEGIQHVLAPHAVSNPYVSYIVYAASALFEGVSWAFALVEFRKAKGKLGYYEAVRTSKNPPAFIVLFEDSAALVGLAIAAAGTFAADRLNMPVLDGAASIGIAAVLGATALMLARESKGLLIGEAASPELRDAVMRTAREIDGIERAQVVFSVHMAPDQVVIALSLEFRDDLIANQIEATVDLLEDRIQQRHSDVIAVFVKPEHQSAPVTLPGRFRNVRLNRASMARVKKAWQPQHDLRKDDAQPDAQPLQGHEVHGRAEDGRH
jgi:cation diffusion facilitator family transporter